jgi:hypothetical protein
MRVTLVQSPEGAPNFCFGLYRSLSAARKEALAQRVPGASRMDADELREAGYSTCVEFVQNDFCLPSLASHLGFVPCECGATDGTVDCAHKKATDIMSAAFDYLAERDGKTFDYNP